MSTFYFCSFTVLNKVNALQLGMVGLSTIKHQHSEADAMDRSHLNQKHMKNANCLQEFVHKKCSECSPFARTHAWRVETLSSLVNCSVNNDLLEIGPYHN